MQTDEPRDSSDALMLSDLDTIMSKWDAHPSKRKKDVERVVELGWAPYKDEISKKTRYVHVVTGVTSSSMKCCFSTSNLLCMEYID